MTKYFYVETEFKEPYREMVVSQDELYVSEAPELMLYNFEKLTMESFPMFRIEYVKSEYSGWVQMMDGDYLTYLPDYAVKHTIEINYMGSNDPLPPGFANI